MTSVRGQMIFKSTRSHWQAELRRKVGIIKFLKKVAYFAKNISILKAILSLKYLTFSQFNY